MVTGAPLLTVRSRGAPGGRGPFPSVEVGAGEHVVVLDALDGERRELLRAILGLEDGGMAVTFGGREVRGLGYADLRRHRLAIGFASRARGLFANRPLGDSIRFPAEYHGPDAPADAAERVSRFLDALDLGAAAGRLPGFVSPCEEMRATVARALVLRPRLLLLDDAWSPLSREGVERVGALLGALRREEGLAILDARREVFGAGPAGDRRIALDGDAGAPAGGAAPGGTA